MCPSSRLTRAAGQIFRFWCCILGIIFVDVRAVEPWIWYKIYIYHAIIISENNRRFSAWLGMGGFHTADFDFHSFPTNIAHFQQMCSKILPIFSVINYILSMHFTQCFHYWIEAFEINNFHDAVSAQPYKYCKNIANIVAEPTRFVRYSYCSTAAGTFSWSGRKYFGKKTQPILDLHSRFFYWPNTLYNTTSTSTSTYNRKYSSLQPTSTSTVRVQYCSGPYYALAITDTESMSSRFAGRGKLVATVQVLYKYGIFVRTHGQYCGTEMRAETIYSIFFLFTGSMYWPVRTCQYRYLIKYSTSTCTVLVREYCSTVRYKYKYCTSTVVLVLYSYGTYRYTGTGIT